MTLFALLLILMIEKVVSKSAQHHIQKPAFWYFGLIFKINQFSTSLGTAVSLLIAILPAAIIWVLTSHLPLLITFLLNLIVLWVCIGCPYTRTRYKNYLNALQNSDEESCTKSAMELCNNQSKQSSIATHMVTINYYQYAAPVMFFVVFGLPGLVFFCTLVQLKQFIMNSDEEIASPSFEQVSHLMVFVDFIPSRIVAFAYLLVGNFSRGVSVWLSKSSDISISTENYLGEVARFSEELNANKDSSLEDCIKMVKLAKRTVIFLLMIVSLLTLFGLIS